MAGYLIRSTLALAVAAGADCRAADEVWRDLSVAFAPESCTLSLLSGTEEVATATPSTPPCYLAAPRGGTDLPAVPRPAGFAVLVVGEAVPSDDGRICGRVLTVVEVTPSGLRQGGKLSGILPLCQGDAPDEKERSILTRSLEQ